MPDNSAKRSKRAALKRHGTLNPHPDAVTVPCFIRAISSIATTSCRSNTRCCAA